ncbi:MAG TPA: response regulator [Solirubrobacteraceae bacterium]|nr:response regulator [Solirubrobacteraceae bacterium]
MISTLIVEDDYHVATIHAAYVRKIRGFTIAGHASTAASARTEIRRLAPTLVLLDLYLPDGHGLDIVRETLAAKGHRPDFLIITAARDMASVRAAMQLGTVHYVVKPFRFAQLEERLNAYRDLQRRLERTDEAEQHEVDTLYGLLRGPAPLPKGQSGPTVSRIREILLASTDDLSAAEIAEQVGISRSTAQRYLAELARQGKIELRLHYGATGRPEHRYRIATATN